MAEINKELWSHIENNLSVLQNRDFLMEIFTKTDRLKLNESIANSEVIYKGKLILDDKKLQSIKKFEYMEFGKYKILEIDQVNIKDSNEPLATPIDKIKVKKGSLANIDKDIETTLGRYILNYLLIHLPLKNKLPYLNTQDELSFKYISKILYDKFINNEVVKDEMDMFFRNMYFIGSMSYIFVPNFTKKSITTHPDMAKRRAELLKKYEKELKNGDAVTMSMIENELIDLDKEWLKDDESLRFYKKNLKKSFNVQRKKQYALGGIVEDLSDSGYKFIDKPFSEGVDEENFSKVANELRAASHSRAIQTQSSGVLAKSLSRTLSSLRHIKGDCKTKTYIKLKINDFNVDNLLNRYIVEKSNLVLLTKENIKKYMNKEVSLRSPMTCKNKEGYCTICLGNIFEKIETGNLDFRALSLSSFYTNLMLRRSHGLARSIYTIDDIDKFVY